MANEISIRVSSPLLFIDDDASSAEPTARESFQSLTVVKRSPQTSADNSLSKSGHRVELTIKGENTVINIQTVKPANRIKHDSDVDDIYELINESVQQIFQSPGKEEIEKALESAGFREKKFTKKGVWKMLSTKASSSPKHIEEERYPSIVLLQDPPENPKPVYRSQSMMSLTPRSLETERSNLENQKLCLRAEREGLEHGKTKLENERRSLARSKSFFIQDQNILEEKKNVLRQVKQSTKAPNLLNKEKLCLELEKQLLEDEKKIVSEELEILGKEKEMIEKEKCILGGERNVLDEERFIFGREKQMNPSDGFSEFEGFEDVRCGHWSFPQCFSHPAYVPVYSLPRPFFPSCGKKSKSVQTQTESLSSEVAETGLPFELLSGIFPRVVITSVKPFSHESAEGESSTVIKEIPEPPKATRKPVPKKPQRKLTTPKSLQIPGANTTLKAVTKKPKSAKPNDKPKDEPMTEKSGLQTMKDDAVSDSTETFEAVHFGLADDFYSNEAIFPGNGSRSNDKVQQLPLTTVGYDMFEKLSQLTLDRELPQVSVGQEGNEPIDKKSNNASNLDLHVSGDGIAITLPGNISMYVKQPRCGVDYGASDRITENYCEDDGKLLVKRSDLWHADTHLSARKKFHPFCQPTGLSIRVADGPEINLTLGNHTDSLNTEQFQFSNETKNCSCDLKNSTKTTQTSSFIPTNGNKLSPRTADLLEALRKKLEFSETERKIVSYGQSKQQSPFDGLYFIRQFKNQDFGVRPMKDDVKPREYLCEECLTTMRLYEDDFHTVQDLVDKFENWSRFGLK